MSSQSEPIIIIEGGICLSSVDGKKFGPGKFPLGTLILTDERIIYAVTPHGLAKATIARLFTPGYIHQTVIRKATQLKPEDIIEAMKDERSFEVHLNNLIEFHESGGYWTGHKAQMKWKTSEGERSVLLTKSGLGGFEQWVDAIKKAKENRVLITQQQSKRKYCMKCGNQLTLEAEFCTKCGTILNINQIGNLKEQSIMITQEKGENPPLLKSIVKEKERSIGSVNLEQIGKLKEIADLSEMIKTNEKTIDILKMRYKKGEIDKGTYEKETSEISNEIIETRSNLQNLYSKFALSEEDFIMEYSKTLRLLDSLNNRLVEGAISEEIYKKFYAEFQMKLDNLREIIKIETSDLQLEITKLEVEKASKNKEIEELKARQMIRQITDEEYERKRKPLDDGIQKMVIEITSKQERLQRFKGLI